MFWETLLCSRLKVDELLFRSKTLNIERCNMLFITHYLIPSLQVYKNCSRTSSNNASKKNQFCHFSRWWRILPIERNRYVLWKLTTEIISTIWSLSILTDFITIVHHFYYFLLCPLQSILIQCLLIHQMNLYNCMWIHFKFRTV
jgi:hypothetical protein